MSLGQSSKSATEDLTHARLSRLDGRIPKDNFWESTCLGIASWAALLIAIPTGLICLLAFVTMLPLGNTAGEAFLAGLVFGVGGSVVAAFAAFLVAILLGSVIKWLGKRAGLDSQNLVLAIFAGGLTALICCSFFPGFLVVGNSGEGFLVFFIFLSAATLFGQVGASRGASKSLKARKEFKKEWLQFSPRFKISDLLWLTVALALVLTGMRALKVPMATAMLVFCSWVVMQSISLLVVLRSSRQAIMKHFDLENSVGELWDQVES